MKLEIRNLKKSYGDKKALNGINATLTEGIYGLLGPNGAGKSTLMNIITGNLLADEGTILFDGQDILKMGKNFRQKLGYMPQYQAYYPSFKVEQFLYYISSLRGLDKQTASNRINELLNLLELSDVRRNQIRTLSGGMRQRLLLAQAVLADPDILILDEPTAGLDPRQRIQVRNLIAEISFHKIVIISTHVVSDVEYIAKEFLLLSKGNILKQETARSLVRILKGKVWEVQLSEKDVKNISDYGTVCAISKDSEDKLSVRLVTEKIPPFVCRNVQPCLEDVYLYYFGDLEGI